MNGDELADSGEDFVVTAAGLLLGWWVGVASRPRESKTADYAFTKLEGRAWSWGLGGAPDPVLPRQRQGGGAKDCGQECRILSRERCCALHLDYNVIIGTTSKKITFLCM